MYRDVAQWHQIRCRIREKGTAKKQDCRDTGISRHTINKMPTHENPPRYGPRPPHYPKLSPYISAIDRILSKNASFVVTCVQKPLFLIRSSRFSKATRSPVCVR
jgi:hypothetical protein